MNFKDIQGLQINNAEISKSIQILNTAKRKVIRINEINTMQHTYKAKANMKSKQLIAKEVKSIAIFSNEYIPKHFPNNNYIEYILNINGKDYKIAPINSNKIGKKMVKFDKGKDDTTSTYYIDESIKSAFLTININNPGDRETPMVSNIKILYGNERKKDV